MSEENKPLPPGWEMKKLGDICDIKGEGVTLHPAKGVNPFLTTCHQCGKDVGLVLLGVKDYIDTCTNCNAPHVGGMEGRGCYRKCMKCGEIGTPDRRHLEKDEKLPIEICDDCKKLNEEVKKMVAEGGIHFRCTKCGSAGGIKKDTPLSKLVREKMNIPTGPCGVELDECPQCESPEEQTTK